MNLEKLLDNIAWVQLIIFIVCEIIAIVFWIIVIKTIVKYFKNKIENPPKKYTIVYKPDSETEIQTQNHGTISNSKSSIQNYNYDYDYDEDDEEKCSQPRSTSSTNQTCTSHIDGYASSPVSGGWDFNNGRTATEDSYGNLYFDNGETAVRTSDGYYYFSDGKTGYDDSYGNIHLDDGQVIIKK